MNDWLGIHESDLVDTNYQSEYEQYVMLIMSTCQGSPWQSYVSLLIHNLKPCGSTETPFNTILISVYVSLCIWKICICYCFGGEITTAYMENLMLKTCNDVVKFQGYRWTVCQFTVYSECLLVTHNEGWLTVSNILNIMHYIY